MNPNQTIATVSNVRYGQLVPSLVNSVPSLEGYVFIRADDNYTTYYNADGSPNATWPFNRDGTIYSRWAPKNYLLAINTNGGILDDGTNRSGSYITDNRWGYFTYWANNWATIAGCFREGYTFAGYTVNGKLGWVLNPDNTHQGIAVDGDCWNGSGANAKWRLDIGNNGSVCTIVAQWTINQYTITLTRDAHIASVYKKIGSAEEYTQIEDVSFINNTLALTFDYNTAYSFTATPTAGYHLESNTSTGNVPARNTTIAFTATPNEYTVTFDANLSGQTVDKMPAARSATYGQPFTIALNDCPQVSGFTFIGWRLGAVENGEVVLTGPTYRAADNETEITVGDSLTTTNNATVTLYAIWTTVGQSVSIFNGEEVYDAETGTYSPAPLGVTANYGADMPPLEDTTFFAKDHKRFLGIFSAPAPGPGVVKYYNADFSSARTWDGYNGGSLWAHYEDITYTVTISGWEQSDFGLAITADGGATVEQGWDSGDTGDSGDAEDESDATAPNVYTFTAYAGKTYTVTATMKEASYTNAVAFPLEIAPDAGASYDFTRDGTTNDGKAVFKATRTFGDSEETNNLSWTVVARSVTVTGGIGGYNLEKPDVTLAFGSSGTNVVLTAGETNATRFYSWYGISSIISGGTSGTNPVTINMNQASEDVDVTVNYAAKSFTVSAVVDAASLAVHDGAESWVKTVTRATSETVVGEVSYGTSVTWVFTAPESGFSDYQFDGWYEAGNANRLSSNTEYTREVTADTTLYAKFKAKIGVAKYNIVTTPGTATPATNVALGGTTAHQNPYWEYLTIGSEVALEATEGEGMYFKHWRLNSYDGEVLAVGKSDTVTVAEAKTYYAIFSDVRDIYSVAIYSRLASNKSYEIATAEFPIPTGVAGVTEKTRTEYAAYRLPILDAFVESPNVTRYGNVDTTNNVDHAVFLEVDGVTRLEINTNARRIIYMDGSTRLKVDLYTPGTAVTTLYDPPDKTGYSTFDGWYYNAALTGNAVTGIPASATGDVTLYAKRTAINYAITYMDGETEIEGLTPATYTVADNVTELPTPTKEGYEFAGWYGDDSLTGDAVTGIALGSTGAKTLYAKWAAETTNT